jgi:hypothetical protein
LKFFLKKTLDCYVYQKIKTSKRIWLKIKNKNSNVFESKRWGSIAWFNFKKNEKHVIYSIVFFFFTNNTSFILVNNMLSTKVFFDNLLWLRKIEDLVFYLKNIFLTCFHLKTPQKDSINLNKNIFNSKTLSSQFKKSKTTLNK